MGNATLKQSWGKVARQSSSAPLKGISPIRGISRYADNTVRDQTWLPSAFRSLVKIGRMAFVKEDRWSFMEGIQKLDEVTPENLEEKYKENLAEWRQRFDELNRSMQNSIYRVYSEMSRLSIFAFIAGVVGAVWLAGLPAVQWWWGFPIFFGIYWLAAMTALGLLAFVSYVRGSRAARGYADVLLVSSLSRVLYEVFQDEPDNITNRDEKKERIIQGIEESARWLRCLPLLLPLKDKLLKSWHCRQMETVTNQLLALRTEVIMSKLGYTEELRNVLMRYFDAALCRDYSRLLDENVKLPPPGPKERNKHLIQFIPVTVFALIFIALFVVDLATGGGLNYVEVLSGTGALTLATLFYQSMGGKEGVEGVKSGFDIFDQIVSRTLEK